MFIILIPDVLILVFLIIVLLPFALLGENLDTMTKVLAALVFLPTLESGIISYFNCKRLKEEGEDVGGSLVKAFLIELITAIGTIIGTYIYLKKYTVFGEEKPGLFDSFFGAIGAVLAILLIIVISAYHLSFLSDMNRSSPVKVALFNIIGSVIAFLAVVIFC